MRSTPKQYCQQPLFNIYLSPLPRISANQIALVKLKLYDVITHNFSRGVSQLSLTPSCLRSTIAFLNVQFFTPMYLMQALCSINSFTEPRLRPLQALLVTAALLFHPMAASGDSKKATLQADQSANDLRLEIFTLNSDTVAPFDFSVIIKRSSSFETIRRQHFSVRLTFPQDTVIGSPVVCLEISPDEWRVMGNEYYVRFVSSNAFNADASTRLFDPTIEPRLDWFFSTSCTRPADNEALGFPVSTKITFQGSQKTREPLQRCELSDITNIFKSNKSQPTLIKRPSDQRAPFDFHIRYALTLTPDCLFDWRSTAISVEGSTSPLGGLRTCSESPKPDITIESRDPKTYHFYLRSGNSVSDDFDMRLAEGTYQATLSLFAEPTCKGTPFVRIDTNTAELRSER